MRSRAVSLPRVAVPGEVALAAALAREVELRLVLGEQREQPLAVRRRTARRSRARWSTRTAMGVC